MLLEKFENSLELSVKQLLIINFSKFDFPTSGYVWFVKNQMLVLFVTKLGIFCIQQELPKSKSNQIPFKRQ